MAYHFPPTGGSGVQRSSKFVRYLPEHGFDPIVVTGPGEAGGRWTPSDPSLQSDVGDGVDVLRVPGPAPGAGGGLVWRARRFVRDRSPFDRWWIEGAARAGRARADAQLVHVSMPPYRSAHAAAEVAAELDVPWVADLRDPWAVEEYSVFPTFAHWWLERREMRRALASASTLVLPTPGTADRVADTFPELRDRVLVIPNGFDPEDFAGPPPGRTDDVFHIVHAGYFYGDVQRRRLRRLLGGTDVDADIFPRSPAFLVRALDRLVDARPELRRRLRLHLAGPLTSVDEAILAETRCRDLVETHGYLPHTESVALVRSADALFLPMHLLPDGQRSTIVPGKLYEYLASGRPILAAVPDGDARDLLTQADWTVVCRPDDTDAIAAGLVSLLDRMGERRGATADRRELLARFERPRLAQDLAGVFRDALAAGR
jgi:glycosyltransferase involved in cell wall biosynthesis